MHVTLRMLDVFQAVARNLNFTRAAEELHLSQPAVSMQIKQLEDSIGLPLFEQLGKKIYLTEAGREMFHYSRKVSDLMSEAELVFEELKGIERGRLDIAVASTANQFGTRLLAAFSRQHPGMTYRLDVTNRQSLIAQLEGNEIDLVVMGRPPDGMDVEMTMIMENPLVVIAAPDHPFAAQETVELKALENVPFVAREEGSGTRIAVERFFSEHGIQLHTSIELSSNDAIKQAVQAGLGLGIVSVHTLSLELSVDRLRVLPVEHFPILRHWYIVCRRGKRLSPLAARFKSFVLENARDFV